MASCFIRATFYLINRISFLVLQVGAPPSTKVEEEGVSYFFRNHTNTGLVEVKTAQSFLELQKFLIKNLQDVKVYRIRECRIIKPQKVFSAPLEWLLNTIKNKEKLS